ncbi:MAG: aldo/keto reductase [Limnochordaceae bacterium]|nr:aldo/keto reductase [Limnochordaceae bacterium]
MEYRPLSTTGFSFSVLGLGTWGMSGVDWGPFQPTEATRILRIALDAGVNWLDTSESFGSGRSEEVIGQALQWLGVRDRLWLCGTVAGHHASPDQIRKALEGSLRRLHTDHLDVYQLGWPNPTVPLSESLEALMTLRQEGKILAIGLANFPVELVRRACELAPIASIQALYNLFEREAELDLLPFCREHGIAFLAHSPLAQGLLAGEFSLSSRPGPSNYRAHRALFQEGVYEEAVKATEQIERVAARQASHAGQAALAWVLDQPGVTAAIVGVRRSEHLKQSLLALHCTLTQQERNALRRLGESVLP